MWYSNNKGAIDMKCPHCGNYLPDDSEFCQYCGVKLGVLQPADIPDAETSHIGKSVLPDRLPDIDRKSVV